MPIRTVVSLLVLFAIASSQAASADPVCVSQKGRLICQVSPACLAEMSIADENVEIAHICVGARAHAALSLNASALGEVSQVNASGQVTLRMDATARAVIQDYIDTARSLPTLSGFAVGECVSVASAYGRGRVTAKVQALFSDELVLLTTYGLGETRLEQLYRIQKSPDCTAAE